MRVNEIFYSLQGEGFLAGVPSIFIRTAGCPLRCRWCDTKYAQDPTASEEYTIAEVVEKATHWHFKHVVITGGEPMIQKDLPQLARELKAAGKHITIETAGIAYIPDMPCDLMSISPKLSNSTPDDAQLAVMHEDSRLDIAVLGELIDHHDYQLKFVVDSVNDLPEIQETLEKMDHVDVQKVMLMPQAATKDELLAKSAVVAEMCKMVGFAFSQRLHILLWDNQRGV
ncbi:MAG: 7-carboxy-7-deazaguanine synthase QueE [Phycisphaerae bacterium]|nr:7-carboxy-7-deazaguanine synthase QueE [Phycisphaerae bacterium]